ncbi:MAG: hypothetical protein IPM48_00780 [Saprospiraceae bacterium]|nr:hypothetical protein [Saprospiraceae bacterium]
MRKTYLFLFLSVLLINLRCDKGKDGSDEPIVGYHYVPFQIGDEWIYETDSIFFNKTNIIERDTVKNFILVQVIDSVHTAPGEIEYALDYSRSTNPEGPWIFADNAFATIGKSWMIRTEFGLDFIALAFPVRKFQRWNGVSRFSNRNHIIIRGELFEPFNYWNGDSYYYKNILVKEQIGSHTYEDVVQVEEVDYEDDLNRIYSESRYAGNIGLVYRELWLLKSQIDDPNLSWDEKAERGLILRQKLHSHN